MIGSTISIVTLPISVDSEYINASAAPPALVVKSITTFLTVSLYVSEVKSLYNLLNNFAVLVSNKSARPKSNPGISSPPVKSSKSRSSSPLVVLYNKSSSIFVN